MRKSLVWWTVLVAALMPSLVLAQTSTNAVDNIVDNVEYARVNVVPIALGAMALFVGLAALLKYWKKVFKG